MDNTEKAEIMYNHLLTDGTFAALSQKLGIYVEFINCLLAPDITRIDSDLIYFNAIYSPASISDLKIEVPVNAKIITFDVNSLKRYPKEEMIAILLHEIGHAFNPFIKGEDGEMAADNFVISRGYGSFLKASLQRSLVDSPKEFNKEITHKRTARIQ